MAISEQSRHEPYLRLEETLGSVAAASQLALSGSGSGRHRRGRAIR
jgi:hypothetical protein